MLVEGEPFVTQWTGLVDSPESNGMAEAFVKTFKRDYVNLNKLENAHEVLGQLSGWFEDYNEMDARFVHARYSQSMPQDWFEQSVSELISQSILKDVGEFWGPDVE